MIGLDEGKITPLMLCDYRITVVITTFCPKIHISLILVIFETTCKAAYSDHNPARSVQLHFKVFMGIFMPSTCSGKYQ